MIPLILIPQWFAAALGQFASMVLSAVRMPALAGLPDGDDRETLAYGGLRRGKYAAMGLSFTLMSFGGGQIIEKWGYTSLFTLGVSLSIVGVIIMWGTLKRPHADGCSPRRRAVTNSEESKRGANRGPLGRTAQNVEFLSLYSASSAIMRTVSMLSVITDRVVIGAVRQSCNRSATRARLPHRETASTSASGTACTAPARSPAR